MVNERIEAAIALGGNVGEVQATFRRALLRLDRHPGITLLRRSDWMEYPAIGGPADQPPYWNGAILVETTLTPNELLEVMREVETHFGRDRSREEVWGPRTLDLDLLLYADQVVDEPNLHVPHKRMVERRFVLEPLAQIAPDRAIPGADGTVSQCLQRLPEGCSL
ncbi:MAG: 2-amino-4-hydroxy-6-hydroxymethyldihydropteridine diphosphokinase [Planctomycetes bacterium]|nr:2-amino-4-hydroxy-6-hydroxymethyldihydropteridine diphosphokinase [Planctomycetota bacterium]